MHEAFNCPKCGNSDTSREMGKSCNYPNWFCYCQKCNQNFTVKICGICKQVFQVHKGDLRNQKFTCYYEECKKVFRYYCGVGNRYWKNEKREMYEIAESFNI